MSLRILEYLTAIAIAIVLAVLLLVVGVSLYRGVTGPEITGLLAAVGTLVGIIVALVGTRSNAGTLADVKDKVNGHLQAHIGHTDQQVNTLVDQRLAAHGLAPPPAPADEKESLH